MEILGKLYEKREAVQRTETFKTREFVLEVEDAKNPQFNNYILFQLVNDRCSIIDPFNVGSQVHVAFDVRGRRWQSPEGKVQYFNSLNAWRVSPVEMVSQVGQPTPVQPMVNGGYPSDKDQLPF